ncbi:hypothetical protein PG984_003883 [Apiospora sp. TS-2023a]
MQCIPKPATSEPGVKPFVLTSSSTASLIANSDTPSVVNFVTWNTEAVAVSHRDPPYEPERVYLIYADSKTFSEKEAWKFVRKKNPGFALNLVLLVLPNLVFGASLNPVRQRHPSTSGMV